MASSTTRASEGENKDSSVSQSQRPCHLQQIPPELRLEIYSHLLIAPADYYIDSIATEEGISQLADVYRPLTLTAEEPDYGHNVSRLASNWTRKRTFVLYPQILATCRLFYAEARNVLLTSNTFQLRTLVEVLNETGRLTFTKMPRKLFSEIRSLQVKLGFNLISTQSFWHRINHFFPAVTTITAFMDVMRSPQQEDFEQVLDFFAQQAATHPSLAHCECVMYDDHKFGPEWVYTGSEELISSTEPRVPDHFEWHRHKMNAMRDVFRAGNVFQGHENCWEWQFEIVTSFESPHYPLKLVRMIYDKKKMKYDEELKKKVYCKNATSTVLCTIKGDYGNMSRIEEL
ncbi:hypothetical protein BT63DRAFT_483261 [Microthyrium microscopicum]|uniref:Uncharacterized protein n=1 Tax=Microthyrium microscopicum TaxID=703497 RepID=A0A6A6TZY7_9PEZI|nr:hypothetical protein BT63DRAFT_483261 [Microthyrium microscopicum]